MSRVDGSTRRIRIAAAGDVHASAEQRDRIASAFAGLDAPDLVLLAGDLTTHGDPREAEVLAEACRGLDVPVYAVLGNHDHHLDRAAEVEEVLRAAGIVVLDREWTIAELDGLEVGIVGTKGFVGGFPRPAPPDLRQPPPRRGYAPTTA